jgi:hypothetical protein
VRRECLNWCLFVCIRDYLMSIFVLVRAIIYATVFVGLLLVYLPSRLLSWSGIVAPATTGAPQVAGMIMVTIGTMIALWCVFTFVFIGKGTPAPFDPPRKLVVRGRIVSCVIQCISAQLKLLIDGDVEAYRSARGIKETLEEMHRCWRLPYADALAFHMDIVASIPEDSAARRPYPLTWIPRSRIFWSDD